jgi:hypothetical protein
MGKYRVNQHLNPGYNDYPKDEDSPSFNTSREGRMRSALG